MPHDKFQQYFEARRNALIWLGQAALHDHNGEAGRTRELLINEFLAAHIPQNLCIGTGQVFGHQWASGAADDISTQQDIVLHRPDMPVLRVVDPPLFFIESVIATLEVRTNYRQDELPKLFEASRSIHSIKRARVATLQMSFSNAQLRTILSTMAQSAETRGSVIEPAEGVVQQEELKPPRLLQGVFYFNGPSARTPVVNRLNALRRDLGLDGPDFFYSLNSGLIVRLNEIDVLREHADSALRAAMDNVHGGLHESEQENGGYRRVFSDGERYRGLEVIVLEIAERCQRYAAAYSLLSEYLAPLPSLHE
jgi:hypothetical protein